MTHACAGGKNHELVTDPSPFRGLAHPLEIVDSLLVVELQANNFKRASLTPTPTNQNSLTSLFFSLF